MKKSTKPRVWTMYPKTAVQLNDGSIHAICYHCNGTGKMYKTVGDTNFPNTTIRIKTTTKCIHCDGFGYEFNEITIYNIHTDLYKIRFSKIKKMSQKV